MIDYDPYALGLSEDPYPVYRELREKHPILHEADGGFWAISRYADVKRALLSPEVFSSRRSLAEPSAGDPAQMPMLVILDPPRHDELRALVNRAFTPRRVTALEARIRQIASDLVDGFVETGRCDLFRDFAAPLPTTVIAELLGVPAEDHEMFKEKSIAIASSVGPAGAEETRAPFDLAEYLGRVFEAKRRRPGDDLMSALLAAEVDGRRLSEPELVGFALLLLIAGNETTTNLICNAALLLDRVPEQRSRLRQDRSLLGRAIEEFLRFDPPVQGVERIPTQDVVVGGECIRKGEKVFLLIAAANRDPAGFAEPERFDVGRDPNPHLSFGFGAHFCLGASLARLETRVAFEELFARLPDFGLGGPVKRLHSGIFRGLLSVPVEFAV